MSHNKLEHKSILTVAIFGTDYKISCPTELQESLLKAAEFFNAKMHEMSDQYNIVGSDRLAILAGLHITHDFLSCKTKNKYDHQHMQDNIKKLNKKIIEAMST
jgi:cell division protein ZapA